jgi:hypothetical protein
LETDENEEPTMEEQKKEIWFHTTGGDVESKTILRGENVQIEQILPFIEHRKELYIKGNIALFEKDSAGNMVRVETIAIEWIDDEN